MSVLESLIEVRLGEEDDFLKVRETLTRIGVASRKDKTLYQSCHILEDPQTPLNQIKILPFKEKNEWSLVTKYNIGRKK